MSLAPRRPRMPPLNALRAFEAVTRLGGGADLASTTLLHDETWGDDWAIWAEGAGVTLPEVTSTARYSLYSMALAEAVAGASVLMGHAPLVADALASRALVRPFG